MDMRLDDTDYETLGGFVYAQLDKIPTTGDVVTFGGLTFTVLATRGRRITKIQVERRMEETSKQENANIMLLPSPGQREEKAQQEDEQKPAQEQSSYRYKGA